MSSKTRRYFTAEKKAKDHKIAQLEEKLTTKNDVIAELMETNVREKKANGGL